MTCYVLYFVYTNGRRMFTRSEAALSSLAESMQYEDVGKVSINDMAKVLFEVLENGDSTVDLDEVEGGYRQYVHLRLNNIVKTYNPDTKKFEKVNNYFGLRRCDESDF